MPTLNELGKKVKAKYPGQYDDMPDLEVGRRTLARYPTEYADFAGADSGRVTVRPHERNKPKRKERLPLAEDIGGAVGGFLGTPGAALGGGIGRAVTRLATDIPAAIETGEGVDPLETIKDIGTGAARQAAYNVAGNLVMKGAKGLGTKAMQAAISATPEVARTAIKEGITPTVMGVKKLMGRLGEAGQQTLNMLRVSTARGNRFDPAVVADGVESILDQTTKTGLPAAADDRAAFQALKAEFLQENLGKTLTPVDLHVMKQKAQAFADPIFKAIRNNQGHTIDAKVAAKARWYSALQDYAKNALESTTHSTVNPRTGQLVSLADANAETAALAELKNVLAPEVGKLTRGERVLRSVAAPGVRLGTGAALGLAADEHLPGGKLAAAGIGAAATTPQALSLYAHLLNSGLLGQLIKQAPRAAGASMREQ